MNRSFLHMSRGSLQMFSGAAGLIAAFAAISLPMLVLPGVAAADSLARIALPATVSIVLLTIALAGLATVLLRFSLSEESHLRTLHSAILSGTEPLRSQKTR